MSRAIVFFGAGNMGGAILRGLASSSPAHAALGIVEPTSELAKQVSTACQAQIFSDPAHAVQWADIVVLAIKPQVFCNLPPLTLLAKERDTLRPLLVISVMAGVTLSSLRSWAKMDNANVHCVRTMPNLPLSVGKGAVAIATDGLCEKDLQSTELLFAPVAKTVRLAESQMDAVTGLAGSGPAWVFQFIEGLVQAGVKLGLSRDAALKLTIATLEGSLEMVKCSGLSPSDLTAQVCSPGGTTIHGLHALEEGRLRAVLMQAVEAAAKRSQVLGS